MKTDAKKLCIAVLLGGFSNEREISLRSGRAISQALSSLGHNVTEIDVKDETVAELDNVSFHVAFIALHGKFGEDGGIQQLLEKKGIPYTGSSPTACSNAMDKLESKLLFKLNKVPMPAYKIIEKETTTARIEQYANELGYPVVLKPRAEGSSIGVTIHKYAKTIENGLAEARCLGDTVIMEKFIPGRELTVGILVDETLDNDEPLPIIELKPKRAFFDYTAKYEDTETVYVVDPKDLDDEIKIKVQETALAAHLAVGCEGFSRVDLILSNLKNVYILEVNAIPGMTERSLLPKAARAKGIEFPQLCERLVKAALRKKK